MNRYDGDVDYPPKSESTDAAASVAEIVPVASLEAIAAGAVRTERLSAGKPQDVARAAAILRSGGIVAFPTETVYGLGANALDAAAVEKIFLAKQRPQWDPLIVHIADSPMLKQVVLLDSGNMEDRSAKGRVEALARKFWPGPLTLLLPRTRAIPDTVTANRPLVGLRMPAHPIAHALIEQAGVPIAAPSANRFGHTSPTSAQHVLDDLDGRIDAVLEGGSAKVGVESTVLDPTQWPMVLYRQGAVTQHMLEVEFGRESVVVFTSAITEAKPESLPSPGVGLRHYAPNARLILIREPEEASEIFDLVVDNFFTAKDTIGFTAKDTIGVMLPDGWPAPRGYGVSFRWGRWDDKIELARRLFEGLRALDELGATVIVCPLPSPEGLGAAIRDRLEKAAKP